MGQYFSEQTVASGEDFCPEVPGGFQSLLVDVYGDDPGFSGQSHFDNRQANRATTENQNVFTRENAGATASMNSNRHRLRKGGPQRRGTLLGLRAGESPAPAQIQHSLPGDGHR